MNKVNEGYTTVRKNGCVNRRTCLQKNQRFNDCGKARSRYLAIGIFLGIFPSVEELARAKGDTYSQNRSSVPPKILLMN